MSLMKRNFIGFYNNPKMGLSEIACEAKQSEIRYKLSAIIPLLAKCTSRLVHLFNYDRTLPMGRTPQKYLLRQVFSLRALFDRQICRQSPRNDC